MYEFEAGESIVAPHAIVDFVADEKAMVFGVTPWIRFLSPTSGVGESPLGRQCVRVIYPSGDQG